MLAEAVEGITRIRNVRRNFANFRIKVTALRRPDGTAMSSRRVTEKVIHDLQSDLLNSKVDLSASRVPLGGCVVPTSETSVLASEM